MESRRERLEEAVERIEVPGDGRLQEERRDHEVEHAEEAVGGDVGQGAMTRLELRQMGCREARRHDPMWDQG